SLSGTVALSNGVYGIYIDGAAGTVIGGTTSAERNVIGGNQLSGILLEAGSTLTTIKGNYIGLGADGTTDVGNGESGILVNTTTAQTIGGTSAADRNVISGNAQYGIHVGAGASGIAIQGNYIGTDASGNAAVGNGF